MATDCTSDPAAPEEVSGSQVGSVEDEAPVHFPHPFHYRPDYDEFDHEQWRETPRTCIEMKLCQTSAAIREKHKWWVKMRDPSISAKWKSEIHEQQKDLPLDRQLSEQMVEYLFAELEGYHALRDEETGIEVGPYERVWRSDSLIPSELLGELLAAVKPLEDVSENEKDWHPGSNGQVLDLVHPSLYPIVYGRTVWDTPDEGICPTKVLVGSEGESRFCLSQRFQWLPSRFYIDEAGQVELISSYINNIHPKQDATLYPVLEKILTRVIPLFERVLSDLRRPSLPWRMKSYQFKVGTDENNTPILNNSAPCVWENHEEPYPDDEEGEQEIIRDHQEWYAKQARNLPEVKSSYAGDLDAVQEKETLRNCDVQVIVKLANIILTPEKPEYPGGVWHVEGMENERIASSAIYYYDSENVSDSHLSFKRATAQPDEHSNGDFYCLNVLYGLHSFAKCVQELGSIPTKAGRCIAFPNVYQHKVSPFRLIDPTKPGHRKILVFFLVDPVFPTYDASSIAPQQRELVLEAMRSADSGSLFQKLPMEILDHIVNFTPAMTRKEAMAYREELMSERKVFVNDHESEYFGQQINMCEH